MSENNSNYNSDLEIGKSGQEVRYPGEGKAVENVGHFIEGYKSKEDSTSKAKKSDELTQFDPLDHLREIIDKEAKHQFHTYKENILDKHFEAFSMAGLHSKTLRDSIFSQQDQLRDLINSPEVFNEFYKRYTEQRTREIMKKLTQMGDK